MVLNLELYEEIQIPSGPVTAGIISQGKLGNMEDRVKVTSRRKGTGRK